VALAPPLFGLIPLTLTAAGVALVFAERARASRLLSNMRVILRAPVSREASFEVLTRRLSEVAELRWAGLVGWQEEELFGWIEREQRLTSERPREAALTSWLIRDAEAGEGLLRASGSEVGGEGLYFAVPLRPDGATAGFLVLAVGGRPPRHLLLALEASAGDLEAAFAAAHAVEEPDELSPAMAAAS
jgi:hypothetical protein